MKFVLDAANVLGFVGHNEKAEQLFDDYVEFKPVSDIKEIRVGLESYSKNAEKFGKMFDVVKGNKDFQKLETFIKLLNIIRKRPRISASLDKTLDVFLYSGLIQS